MFSQISSTLPSKRTEVIETAQIHFLKSLVGATSQNGKGSEDITKALWIYDINNYR
jgi:hypothetical protein